MTKTDRLLSVLKAAPVVPVIIVDRVEDAVPLARALVAGGLPALEVTLRTADALKAITAMKEVPGAVVGAGTILSVPQAHEAIAAGAEFLVSPGATDEMLDAIAGLDVPLLPGIATASEAMRARAKGYKVLKFFPAGPAGGPAYLKSLASPLADVVFCPTGGVTLANAKDYLACPNVVVVGGSWLLPADVIKAGDWGKIEQLAREAASLKA